MNPTQENNGQDVQPGWTYTSGNLTENTLLDQSEEQGADTSNDILAKWSASEFVSHDKTTKWYVVLGLSAVVLSAIIFVLTRQILSVVVVAVMTLLFAVYASAKPRTLDYSVSNNGVQIGEKYYPFSTIKSYSVIEEEGIPYLQLLLQKRLSVPIVVYAAPDQIDQLAEIIGNFVPYDQKKRDIADKISSRIRF